MARLFHDGFEYNNVVNNYPWTVNGGGAATYVTTTVRNGTYAGQISGLVSGTNAGWLMQFAAATGTGPYYCRFYINITTLPSAANSIFKFTSGATLLGTQIVAVRLNSTGTLTYFNGPTNIGTGSTALTTGRWYMIEVKFDNTGGAGHGVMEVKINGTVELTTSTQTFSANVESFMLGGNLGLETQTQGKWFFDDVAINDSTGVSQTGYPGQGNIIRLKPNAAGDNNQFVTQFGGTAGAANNYTRVNAVDLSQALTYNGDHTSGHIDDFNLENTPAAINNASTINVVTVDLAAAASDISGGQPSIKPRIKKAAAGTVSSGTAFTPPNSGTTVVNKSTPPWIPTLVLYNDPDGAAWTKTALDSAQVGYTDSAGTLDTDAFNVSIQVDFVNNYVESATISTETTPSAIEGKQFTDSNTPSSKTAPSSTEIEKSIDLATVSSKSVLSSVESQKSIELSTLKSSTALSSTESARYVESATPKGITTPISASETRQSVDSCTIRGITTLITTIEASRYVESRSINTVSKLISADISQFIEIYSITSRSYAINSDIYTARDLSLIGSKTSLAYTEGSRVLDSTTVKSATSLLTAEITYYVESGAILSKTVVSSSELLAYEDSSRPTTSTTLSAGTDVVGYIEGLLVTSTTVISGIEVQSNLPIDSATITSRSFVLGSEFLRRDDFATITSRTTLVDIKEIKYIVELVGTAFNHYTAGVDVHYESKVIKHFNAQAVI